MNAKLVGSAALIATLTGLNADGDPGEARWRKLRARVGEKVRYRRTLRHLPRRLDLGRGDLPGFARRPALVVVTDGEALAGRAQVGIKSTFGDVDADEGGALFMTRFRWIRADEPW